MSTPTVTETTRRPESVEHDTFIDDLARPLAPPASARRREPERAA